MNDDVAELIGKLAVKDNKTACGAMELLADKSSLSPDVYHYFDIFVKMMRSKKSYERNRAFILIGSNARWDEENKIDAILDEYMNHVTDEKAITARQCLKGLSMIEDAKPEFGVRILEALKCADISKYADSMKPLIDNDIKAIIEKIENK